MRSILGSFAALLLGFLLGMGATVYLIAWSQAGDFLIRKTEAVQTLQRRVDDVEKQRDLLLRQLSDVADRAGRMEKSFNEIEQRFRALQDRLAASGAAETPTTTLPPQQPAR
jgi:hypothetical protein